MSAPSLKFVPGGAESGFTTSGLSSYEDGSPSEVVRELVQNALDAAVAASKACARVCFSMRTVPVCNVPGIKEYRTALKQAVTRQEGLQSDGVLPDQAQRVVEKMEKALLSPKDVWVLSVRDNGVGLDEKRMSALLADGVSRQDNQESTGAYGNGHMVAIPASRLRYVLYGGITANGQMICSGHAVIASHANRGKFMSKDGYYVTQLRDDAEGPRYLFPKRNAIPQMVLDEVKAIRSKWETGTAVIIPGFTRFTLPNFDLWGVISRTVASNFFCAVRRGELVVETKDEKNDETKRLDQGNIEQVLRANADEKRVRRPFLPGCHANSAFLTLAEGPVSVGTPKGSVDIHVRHLSTGSSRVDLCRNGMWITDRIPGFQGAFSDRKPFHCVICVDRGDEARELQRLIRAAEGPLHTELKPRSLSKEKENELRSCLDIIKEAILKEVPALDGDSFSPHDVLVVPVLGDGSKDSKGEQFSLFGIPTPLQTKPMGNLRPRPEPRPRPMRRDPPDPPNPPRPSPPGPRQEPDWGRRPLGFEATPVPAGRPRSYRVGIVPLEDYPGGELRLVLDESIDATCTDATREPFVTLENVKINGEDAPASGLVRNQGGQVIGVRMSGLIKGVEQVVETEYRLPADLSIPDSQEVVLGIEIKRCAAGGGAEG